MEAIGGDKAGAENSGMDEDAGVRQAAAAAQPGAEELSAMREILIADDHPLFRDALRRTVAQILPDARLHEADSVDSLSELAHRHPRAELLLLDLNMPGAHGFSALVHLRAAFPTLPILMISAREDPALMRRALGHGASGFIPKSAEVEQIARAIHAVLAGDTWLPPGMSGSAVSMDPEEEALAARVAELTPQQYRVLAMVCNGLLNKQIAYALNVSEATIKAHMTAILRKLGAHSRTQAVLLAAKLTVDGSATLPPQDDDE
jgi:DNA-binding NarL/FixJ family response regulator